MSTTVERTAPRPLCEGRVPEYWETGDDGNRLALMLCNVCPARVDTDCNAGTPDPTPTGVIRAGVPYDDDSRPLPVGDCGYPHQYDTPCRLCVIPSVPIPDPKRVLRWRIRDLHAAGHNVTTIATEVHRAKATVIAVLDTNGWKRATAPIRATCGCGCGEKPRKTGALYVRGHRSVAKRNNLINQRKQVA